jgi:hypothetical protein
VKSGQIKFITIIINDNEILEKAERIVVNSGNQKSEELINKRKGIIISDLGEEGSEELIITLLDKARKLLFSSKLQGIDSKVTDIISELKKGNFSRINTESQSVLKPSVTKSAVFWPFQCYQILLPTSLTLYPKYL